MIKLIATDIDGTLLNGDGELPSGFTELVLRLENKGVYFAIASGRQYHTLLNDFASLKDKLIFIAENGALVMHHGKELFFRALERHKVEGIIKDIRNAGDRDIVLCGKKTAYVETTNTEFEAEVRKYYFNCELVHDLLDVEDDILKIALYDYIGSQENSYDMFSSRWQQEVNVIVSGKHWMDFGRPDVDKGISIKYLQDKLGVSCKETMVFGDYFNDVPMMEAAYYSYAMKNAPSEVKAQARFEAPSNIEEGVLKVIDDMEEKGFI
ncbi:HAD family hydrolase [Acetivibrio cellulolyticus]|uniref:HAD family hydrolase n=1 Tax=Acetivibrio cellulolyticus TaxID=35830 RepID=UPI0001E2DE7F|nr:HAD family hydrolase [Acetivibrio cellulolyticus]